MPVSLTWSLLSFRGFPFSYNLYYVKSHTSNALQKKKCPRFYCRETLRSILGRMKTQRFENSKLLFDEAKVFMEAARLIHNNSISYRSDQKLLARHSIAANVNFYFAVELYSKCLLSIETGAIPHSHDLVYLFEQLSQRTKDDLLFKYCTYTKRRDVRSWGIFESPTKDNFFSELTEARNKFVELRYISEEGDLVFKNEISGIVFHLKQIILEMRPDFRDT